MTNKSFGCLQDIPQTYTKAYILNDLVRVFGVDGVLDCLYTWLPEFLRRDLNQIFNRRLSGRLENALSFGAGNNLRG